MASVSFRLEDQLNEKLEDMIEKGIFKNKTDALHEATRLLMLRYKDFET
ncbi:MAG: hypothetical protein ABEI78_00780 [Candidatus Nanohaloarchaea archaeon]